MKGPEPSAVAGQQFPTFYFTKQKLQEYWLEAARKQWLKPSLVPEQSLIQALQCPGTGCTVWRGHGNSTRYCQQSTSRDTLKYQPSSLPQPGTIYPPVSHVLRTGSHRARRTRRNSKYSLPVACELQEMRAPLSTATATVPACCPQCPQLMFQRGWFQVPDL